MNPPNRFRVTIIGSLAVIGCSLYACRRTSRGKPDASAVSAATPPDHLANELRQAKFCSDAAAEFWNRHNWRVDSPRTTYTNHFNETLKKCLVDIHDIEPINKGRFLETDHIYDALENKVLGARLLTKEDPEPDSDVVQVVLIRDGHFVKSKEEVAAFMPWFEGLMTQ